MRMSPKASVIIAFYNKLDLLKIILSSLNNQYDGTFNVIIADDGSRPDVVDGINEIISQYDFEIIHVWQEDIGFRKNRILNRSVVKSNDYIIFIDGDCIPQDKFVFDHLENAMEGYCLNGRRVDLSSSVSSKITTLNPDKFFIENLPEILIKYILSKGKNIEKGFRITNKKISNHLNRKLKGIVGCNFSLYKKDILEINGFDERYQAAGTGEDSDVEYRLRLSGVEIKNIFYKANQVHIFHKELPRSKVNDSIFEEVQNRKIAFTEHGIIKSER
ncbi:glycosyl transferase [Enterovibrio norvegicus FF-33]|uniref:glycosyltransferase n=1 Tax=Enterovibrio norvegicus TaxID=188144 RepID=UPI00030E48E5|nr:glycosyltransferase [Enterovibrio norvegicus]OEE68786.1 glycosyl transferase [Enterovibrio norvegicus FF-33]